MSGQALAKREDIEALTREVIKTPHQLAERVRQMQEVAHILSPAVAVSSIAPGWKIDTGVVVIDPRFDAKTGAGDDVYYQASIHKSTKGDGETYVPVEVSLNAKGLARILATAGIEITDSARTDNGREQYYWSWSVRGVITDFNGTKRRLPPGDAEIDYRDGSAGIGEWTPAKWAERVAAAEQRKASLRDSDKWKAKPEAINGWTADRVMNARRFGLRIVQTEALNRLIRGIGIKQKYTIAELAKPFVLFRCSPDPDMSDPETRRIVTAAQYGAAHLLYPASAPPAATAVPSEQNNYIDIHASSPDEDAAAGVVASTGTRGPALASTAPAGAQALEDLEDPPVGATYHIEQASQLVVDGVSWYFFSTKQGATLATADRSAARELLERKKSGQPLTAVVSEQVTLNGQTYLHPIEWASPASGMPDPRKL